MLVQYEYKMKILYLAIIAISFTVVSIFTHNAFASVELNGYMAINGHPVTPIFKFSKSVLIDYPSESKLQQELDGKNVTVEFADDSDHNPTIKSFTQQLNVDIANERRSFSRITNLSMQYEAIIHGDDKQARIDYSVTLKPTLVNYVINSGGEDVPTVLDASWMGFSIKDPVVITTKQYGDLEVNFPLGVIQNQLPDTYDAMKVISTENILKTNLMDANPLVDYQIDKWNTLFDPTFTLDESAGPGYVGQMAVVTGFAYGQHDLYSSPLKSKIDSIDFTTDSKYHLTIIEKPSSATLNVQGHASGYLTQGEPAISTLILTSGKNLFTYTGAVAPMGLSNIVIYIIVGSIVLIVGVIFWWNYKKRKK